MTAAAQLGVAVRVELTAVRRCDLEQLIAELTTRFGPRRALFSPVALTGPGTYAAVGFLLLPMPGTEEVPL